MHFFHQKSEHCEFIHADFAETMRTQATDGDVVYCDPPYAPLDSNSFTAYTQSPFGTQQQLALTREAEALAERGITVLISNHDTPFTRKCYQNADILSFEIQRTVSCKGAERRRVKELIAIFR